MCFTFTSLVQFKLNFVYSGKLKFYSFAYKCPTDPESLVEKATFFNLTAFAPLQKLNAHTLCESTSGFLRYFLMQISPSIISYTKEEIKAHNQLTRKHKEDKPVSQRLGFLF